MLLALLRDNYRCIILTPRSKKGPPRTMLRNVLVIGFGKVKDGVKNGSYVAKRD